MKRLFLLFIFFIWAIVVQGQNHVFVLVDVSKSVRQNQLIDAKQALKEVLMGASLTKAFISQGTAHDLANFKLAYGDKLSVSKFGSLKTTLAISPNPTQIQNPAPDISSVLNSIGWIPTDDQTYIQLAKAKIAEYAKNHKIGQYKLYIISDNVQDDYGPGGKPNYSDDYTRNLAEGYNTSTSPVIEHGSTKLKFAANSLFTLSFSPVDVSKYILPGGGKLPSNTEDNMAPTITLTSFADGKKDRPKSTNANSFTISWACNCPTGVKFNVALTEVEGGKYKDLSKKNVNSNSVRFSDVPYGKFKVVVSASNATPAMTFVETPSSGLGWILALLILAAAGGAGYYFWNKKRQEKIDLFASNRPDDIFSKSGRGTGNNSSNTDYF